MKVRTLRKRAHRMMDTVSWWAALNDTKMYYIRKVKPCKEYNPWCDDCNSVLFRREMGRFPYTVSEFNDYGAAKQEWYDKHEAAHEAARKLAEGKEFIMGDIDVPNAELTDHLNQDLDAKLARWLSSRLDAREVVRTHHVYTPSPDADTTEWELNNDQPSREG